MNEMNESALILRAFETTKSRLSLTHHDNNVQYTFKCWVGLVYCMRLKQKFNDRNGSARKMNPVAVKNVQMMLIV